MCINTEVWLFNTNQETEMTKKRDMKKVRKNNQNVKESITNVSKPFELKEERKREWHVQKLATNAHLFFLFSKVLNSMF